MTTTGGPVVAARVLVASSHPLPTVAVTAFSAGLAISIGLSADVAAIVVGAVLCGQLSIGWSNDLIDAGRDAAAGRPDKPLAESADWLRLVTGACALAVATCLVLSLWVGLRPGLAHVIAVACGWAYNIRLKGSAWSWAPFALAFGLLPVFVYGGLPGAPSPPGWVVVTAGLLGIGAHLLNAAPDLDDDLQAGVRGAAVRMGANRAVGAAFACFGAAAAVAAWGAQEGAIARLMLAVSAAVLVAAALTVGLLGDRDRRYPRAWFRAALLLIAAEVVLILLAA